MRSIARRERCEIEQRSYLGAPVPVEIDHGLGNFGYVPIAQVGALPPVPL